MTEKIAYGIFQRHRDTDGRLVGLANGPFGFLYDQVAATLVAYQLYADDGFIEEINLDYLSQWGFGRGTMNWQTKQWEEKVFETVKVGQDVVGLMFGEHKHSSSDNNIYARFSDGRIEGFSGHRLLHSITFEDYNYLKTSGLSGNEVRKGGTCKIFINDLLCGKFFYREVSDALIAARQYLLKFEDFPIQLWKQEERDKLIGRKIYFHDHPAVIRSCYWEELEVIIEADPSPFPLRAYQRNHQDEYDFEEDRGIVKDTIFSPHIWWFR